MNQLCRWIIAAFALMIQAVFPTSAAPLPRALLSDTAGHTWLVDIAATPQSHARGLMYRPYLPPWKGMLFVFTRAQESAFWMKNTLTVLDIRFYDSLGNPLARYPYLVPCWQRDCPVYPSDGPARYVLEVRPAAYFANAPAPLLRLILLSPIPGKSLRFSTVLPRRPVHLRECSTDYQAQRIPKSKCRLQE